MALKRKLRSRANNMEFSRFVESHGITLADIRETAHIDTNKLRRYFPKKDVKLSGRKHVEFIVKAVADIRNTKMAEVATNVER